MATIPLEDNFNDIIGKAQRGLKLDDATLAERAGIHIADLQGVKAGEFDEAAVRQLAPHLQLAPDALVVSGQQAWRPQHREIAGLVIFNTPFEDMTVNSYLVFDPASKRAVAFDTGADASGMWEFARKNDLRIELILLTHIHGDHIEDLARLKSETGAPVWVCELEPVPGAKTFMPGQTFEAGALRIETRQTSGHARGGVTFVVSGLDQQVAVVGDALFAGSMGGGMVSYEEALRTNREQIFALPDDTILCPGHGPLTTVGEEKQHNPFYPEFKP